MTIEQRARRSLYAMPLVTWFVTLGDAWMGLAAAIALPLACWVPIWIERDIEEQND